MMRRASLPSSRAAALALLAAAGACHFENSPIPSGASVASAVVPTATPVGTVQGRPTTATIDAAGGALSAADGGVTLTVPAGAVSTPTVFSATPITMEAPGAVGGAYRLEAGGSFRGPVKVTFNAPVSYPSGVSLQSFVIRFQDARGFWLAPDQISYDGAANTISATTSHLSDWSVVLGQTPSLTGTFVLNQFVGIPFTASGTASLYPWSGGSEPTYYMTGTITLPGQLTSGTATCVPDAPTKDLELSVAEIHDSLFRWGIDARWALTCTDASTGAIWSQDLGTTFDTMFINLTSCPSGYTGTQVNGPAYVQGSYTIDCGTTGAVTASWDFQGCVAGGSCQPANVCDVGAVVCSGSVGSCSDSGVPVSDGTSCGTYSACVAGACTCTDGAPCTPTDLCHTGGTVSCSPTPTCVPDPATQQPAGTVCGNGQTCDSTGTCL